MSTKQSHLSAFGKAQTEGMLNLQKELLETYEQASRAWLDRVRSEVELWSRLGEKLTATRSVPEAMDAYQKCVGERMQMAAEDGKRLFDECQNITQKIAGSLNAVGGTEVRETNGTLVLGAVHGARIFRRTSQHATLGPSPSVWLVCLRWRCNESRSA